MTGEWPAKDIDHRDGNASNNKWYNLRETTMSQNIANAKVFATNTSGRKGVYWHNRAKKWMAAISFQRKQIYLGLYSEKEDAAAAYERAAIEYFGEFARLS